MTYKHGKGAAVATGDGTWERRSNLWSVGRSEGIRPACTATLSTPVIVQPLFAFT